jgi:glyoxylase-like metal-dependent hydrolase (beta-lactamase superfamily II)
MMTGLEQVRDDVWALTMPMPGEHMPYSLLYLLRGTDGGVHVVDPGLDAPGNWRVFASALADIGSDPGDVASILVTHLHPDHLGMAARMREATDAPVLLHREEQAALEARPFAVLTAAALTNRFDEWGVPADRREELASLAGAAPRSIDTRADAVVDDGERLGIPGFDVEVIWTPGHTRGSMSLRDSRRGILLTGDHVLPKTYSGLGLGSVLGAESGDDGATPNPLADYLASLERVSRYVDDEVLPGHEFRFTGIEKRSAELAEHHLRRSREVAAVQGREPDATVWHIAKQLTWTAGWNGLHGFFLFSALSQTDMHRCYLASADASQRE